ncbi:MAG: diaminopimelate epimerase [Opitutales bacterium]|nr:diaminopimelate epimerase [Opitutales bacterium]
MKFAKYHALGNDYLVLDPENCPACPQGADVIKICHRNFGLGSDGILFGPEKSEKADFKLRILNPDASEAEKSGNGLRIFSRYLFDTKRVAENSEFSVETLGGIVRCKVLRGGDFVVVEMGKVSFDAKKIPVLQTDGEVVNKTLEIAGKKYKYCAATIGNPHCVLPLESVSKDIACSLGPAIENMTELFPNRTNVQFLQAIDRKNIKIEIWERGAGYTLASGSSSSAAAAVARKLGLVDSEITVHCPGGDIFIQIAPDYSITMGGAVVKVGEYEMSPGVLNQTLPI